MLSIISRCISVKSFTTLWIFVLSDINRIIYQTHSVICSLMLECITILLTKVHNELNDFWCRIRNLNGICLYVCNSESTLLYLMFKIHHEQSAALSDNVILVSNIMEWIRECRRGKTIYRVDRSLQCVSQIFRC